jgi:hypothetical protein
MMEAVVSVVLHKNDTPPVAVNVTEPPTQIEESDTVMLHTGSGATLTVNEHELVHPLASVTVTV